MAATNVNNEKVKYKAISGRLSDDYGFKSSDDGRIVSAENILLYEMH